MVWYFSRAIFSFSTREFRNNYRPGKLTEIVRNADKGGQFNASFRDQFKNPELE